MEKRAFHATSWCRSRKPSSPRWLRMAGEVTWVIPIRASERRCSPGASVNDRG
jgi:Tfp pilus assembly protein PilZ